MRRNLSWFLAGGASWAVAISGRVTIELVWYVGLFVVWALITGGLLLGWELVARWLEARAGHHDSVAPEKPWPRR